MKNSHDGPDHIEEQVDSWFKSRGIDRDAPAFARRSEVRDADATEHLADNRWRLWIDGDIRERRVPAALERWCRSKPSPADLEDADQDVADVGPGTDDQEPLPSEKIQQPWRREKARQREQEARR